MSKLILNPEQRWSRGIVHHPKSIELMESLKKIDMEYGDDYFCWKSGGDGDNGEMLMYLLDIMYDIEESTPIEEPPNTGICSMTYGGCGKTVSEHVNGECPVKRKGFFEKLLG